MLYALANGGCIITVPDRNPDTVLSAIEKHRAELLPTSPTFLNLILLGDAYRRFNLSSLKTVTYGTEPMPESTLKRFHALFPDIQLLQTYGLSETGILRSKSKSSDSLWMKVGGEGFETRVVDGILHIKAESAMLGYLNAPSPFTADGWINTGDQVETDGEYIRVLGRKSEIINVGGEKVYPSEVESVIHELDNVAEATVYGEKNFIMGNIVCAKVSLVNDENADVFAARLKKFCAERMQRYKVPVKVEVVNDKLHSERVKKIRKSGA
jgi:acyl-CoA synthetase (AMP-forming)/AMP-acid ligase II